MIEQVERLAQLAHQRRLAKLVYQRPALTDLRPRWVEPYSLAEGRSTLLVLCYQVRPEQTAGWKNFRIDRIISVEDGGRTFLPRAPITLSPDQVVRRAKPFADYAQRLEEIAIKGRFTQRDFDELYPLAQKMPPRQLRWLHADLLRDVLEEVLIDDVLTDSDARYLHRLSAFLKRLGWSLEGGQAASEAA
ncbi:MAG TPA: WYL domain-containing protein [Phycisphaeraceae bacterium]